MSNRRTPRAAQPRAATVTHHLALDRFEADRDGVELAVLITDAGRAIVVPRTLLPPGAEAGTSLNWTLVLDPATTAAAAQETASIRADLKRTDPGGTIKL